MKVIALIAVLVAGGVAFYMMGGMEKLGLTDQQYGLPDTIDVPHATFMGDADQNPYAQ